MVVYQHEPFLNNFNKQQGSDLREYWQKQWYSRWAFTLTRLKAWRQFLQAQRSPSQMIRPMRGRALILLEQAGLIKLKAGAGGTATVHEIIENPKTLKFKRTRGCTAAKKFRRC